MKKYFILLIIIIIMGGVTYSVTHGYKASEPQKEVVSTSQSVAISGKEQTTTALPVTLVIPSLAIHTEIEYVGMDKNGNMDVPKRDENVAWFKPGYVPGTSGNAVIAGHLDTKSGAPAIFYNLANLKKGDLIQILAEGESTISFRVTKIETYPGDTFPLEKVFGPSDKPQLNLITCEGTYDKTKGGYSHRTVVFSEQVE